MKLKSIFPFFLILVSCFSCSKNDDEDYAYRSRYKPVFLSRSELDKSVKVREPRAINESGKIHLYNNLLLMSEPDKGVHIYGISDPSNPIPLKFIQIIGNRDISVKDGILIANNAVDLVSIDIKNLDNIRLVDRLRNVFPEVSNPDEFYYNYNPYPNRPDSLIIVKWRLS